jgi:hypothetical protein
MLKFKAYLNEAREPVKKPEGKMSRLEKAVGRLEKVAKKPVGTKAKSEKKPSKWATPKAHGTTVMVFGRMNPVTAGHEKVVQQAARHAEKLGGRLKVVASHSEGNEQNPLDPKTKLKHLKRAFPGVNVELADKHAPTIMHHLKKAYDEGTKDVVVYAGGDRVKEYEKLLKNYNGAPSPGYRFRSIKVVNAGSRGPGAISGTEQREVARAGDFNRFRSGLPSSIATSFVHSRELFNDTARAVKKYSKQAEKKKKK